MITPEFIYIPVKVRNIIPIGVGSAKINKDGEADIIAFHGGFSMGKKIEEDFRAGKIEYLEIRAVYKETPSE